MPQLGVTKWDAKVCPLSKPTITDRGGLFSYRAIAASIAAACPLLGRAVSTSRAQHWAHAKL